VSMAHDVSVSKRSTERTLACMVTGNSSALSLKHYRPGIKMWFHHLCRRYNKAQPIGYTGVKVQLQGH
jgi:hypothetical protein